MNYLVASVLILAVGPLLYHGFRHQPRLLHAIGAFVVVSLCGLVLFDILPGLWQQGGLWVIPVLLLGMVGPNLAERAFRRHSRLTHNLTLFLGLSGLLLHTLTDGSAIYLVSEEEASALLAMGIVLHRMPAGLAVWWLLRPQFGLGIASLVLGVMMVFTLAGFLAGEELLHHLTQANTVYLQAFVTGSILHVLLHRPHEHHGDPHHSHRLHLSSGHYLGSALGLVFLVLMMLSHHDHDHGHGHQHEPAPAFFESDDHHGHDHPEHQH